MRLYCTKDKHTWTTRTNRIPKTGCPICKKSDNIVVLEDRDDFWESVSEKAVNAFALAPAQKLPAQKKSAPQSAATVNTGVQTEVQTGMVTCGGLSTSNVVIGDGAEYYNNAICQDIKYVGTVSFSNTDSSTNITVPTTAPQMKKILRTLLEELDDD
jgi:hypothetical protein